MSFDDDLRARRLAGLSGLAFVVLFGGANALWALDTPELGAVPLPQADIAEILAFYRGAGERIVAGALISLVSIAVFVVFAAAVRRVLLGAGGDDVLSLAAVGGGLLAMAMGLGAETLNMVAALRAGWGELDAPLARALFDVSQVLGFNAAGVGLGVFLGATAVVALRSPGVLPRWLSLAALLVGVSLVTPLSRVTLVLGLFVLAGIAVVLLRGAPATSSPGGPTANR